MDGEEWGGVTVIGCGMGMYGEGGEWVGKEWEGWKCNGEGKG